MQLYRHCAWLSLQWKCPRLIDRKYIWWQTRGKLHSHAEETSFFCAKDRSQSHTPAVALLSVSFTVPFSKIAGKNIGWLVSRIYLIETHASGVDIDDDERPKSPFFIVHRYSVITEVILPGSAQLSWRRKSVQPTFAARRYSSIISFLTIPHHDQRTTGRDVMRPLDPVASRSILQISALILGFTAVPLQHDRSTIGALVRLCLSDAYTMLVSLSSRIDWYIYIYI